MTEQNPENLSSDELESLIEEASDAGEGFPDLHDDVVSVDREPVEPEPVEDPQDQLDLDADDADAEPLESEADVAENQPQAEPDEIDVLRRELELAEKRAKHFESKLGGGAGRAGYLESRVQELEEQLARVADAQNALAYEHASQSRVQPQPVPELSLRSKSTHSTRRSLTRRSLRNTVVRRTASTFCSCEKHREQETPCAFLYLRAKTMSCHDSGARRDVKPTLR